MPRHLHFTKFLIASIALHALLIIAAFYLIKPALTELPFTPVRIVNLPPQETRQLPPVQRPEPPRPAPAPPPPPTPVPPPRPAPVPPPRPAPQRIIPEKRLPPGAVPLPKKFGESEELKLPKTSPGTGVPGGAETGGETGKGKTGMVSKRRETGQLPFLSQNDIDELARKGMPDKQPGDDSVTLDTDEFKFMSYNRWLKIKIESMLKYPELAAVSGYQGTLYIKFDINKDGTLGGLEVLQSSGYKILDDEALRSIRASAPFAPLPDDWKMDRYSIRAAVIFYLGGSYVR
ncbi:MAG TPA: energy transducer TonB [Nitrospirota bacterium]|nr:energy transducer TonB [Nitrospirota bacterium]